MCESSEKLRRALRYQVRTSITQSYKNGDVFYKRNLCDRWLGPETVIGWEHKQGLVEHGGTYVRVHPSCLVPYPVVYQNSSESESMVEPTTSQVGPKETSNISIFGENNVEEELGTLNDHVEQHQTVRNGLPKQNSNQRKIELPKPGQTIECKLANDDDDSEWKKLNVIRRAGKATGKNKHLMNVAMEQGEPFWLDFEHGVREWKACEIKPTSDNEHTFGDEENNDFLFDRDLESARENELQSWIENKVYTQVFDQGQPRISTRWVYTHKNVNNKQVCKARLVARGFKDRDAGNIRNDSPTCSKEGLCIALAITASNHWKCKSMDIKTAFLQGKELDRLVYLEPPKKTMFLLDIFGNSLSAYMVYQLLQGPGTWLLGRNYWSLEQ